MKKSLASLTTFKYIGTKTRVYVTIFGVSKKMRNVMNSILILSSKPINDTELKVLPTSLADKGGLQVGDYLLRIGNQSTDDMLHHEAQDAIKKCYNNLDLQVKR